MPNERIGPLLKTLVFTIVVPGSVGILIPQAILPPGKRANFDVFGVAGFALGTLGAAIYLWCAWQFAYHGFGTPAPIDPPKTLVVRGLHRVVRNPMYIGVLLVVLGQASVYRSRDLLIYAACFWLAAHLFVVFYEEPTLKRQFGENYEDYSRQVPRWIPWLPRSSPR
jgi:protein-S-isoprenylcysteine O-methyltransferase Ste14